MSKMKLTPAQKKVIQDLQDGSSIFTDSAVRGADICNSNGHYHINNGLFRNLVHKGLIHQDIKQRHNYVLSQLGSTIELN